jgi:hypothetical protein
MGEDFDRERQEYFDNISGVGEWQGQKFRWSRWAWDIAYHPAMLGRGRGAARRSPWDPLKPFLFLGVVIGIPALIVFLSAGGMSLGTKLIIVLGAAAGIFVLVGLTVGASARRMQRNASKPFPHPGPKGRHRHR